MKPEYYDVSFDSHTKLDYERIHLYIENHSEVVASQLAHCSVFKRIRFYVWFYLLQK